MKTLFRFIGLSVIATILSCSQTPGDVLLNIKKQHSLGNYNNLDDYYTRGTVKAMKELDKLSLKNKTGKPKQDKKFAEGTDWDVVSEKMEGDKAEVKIKYTKHPVENMIGLELIFNLLKEDGKWKVDMEKDLGRSLELLKMTEQISENGKAYYLNKSKQIKLKKD